MMVSKLLFCNPAVKSYDLQYHTQVSDQFLCTYSTVHCTHPPVPMPVGSGGGGGGGGGQLPPSQKPPLKNNSNQNTYLNIFGV